MAAPIQDLVYFRSTKDSMPENDENKHSLQDKWQKKNLTPSRFIRKSLDDGSPCNRNDVVQSMHSWDIKLPPIKKHMIGGHLVPTVKNAVRFLVQRKRKIAIERHGPPAKESASLERSGVQQDVMAQLLEGKSPLKDIGQSNALGDGDEVVLRILAPKESSDDVKARSIFDDSKSLSTLGLSGVDEDIGGELAEWSEQTAYKLDQVNILRVSGRVVEMKFGLGNDTIVRDLKFESPNEALSFRKVVDTMIRLEKERTVARIEEYKDSQRRGRAVATSNDPQHDLTLRDLPDLQEEVDRINLLIEIVSANNLPASDTYSARTDAYIKVKHGGTELHRTGVVSNSFDPIWTLSTGSLFLLQMAPEEFFSASTSGMIFTIKDRDSVGSNEPIGRVEVPLDDLVNGSGERVGYDILLEQKLARGNSARKSRLYLRYRIASQEDIDFMVAYTNSSSKVGVFTDETYLSIRKPTGDRLFRPIVRKGSNREFKHLVRPFPDPEREEATKWMSSAQIQRESEKHSTHWVEAGSGHMGKVYVEVIGCDGLPNMDRASLKVGDKTDAFASIVFEDCTVNSDVILDSLSPRWMPWCRRAFVFNVTHPSSHLNLGVFDFDPEWSPVQLASRATSGVHDPIGRIIINLSFLEPSTTYTLTYPLHYSEVADDRMTPRGTVTVRIRKEFESPRKAILAGLDIPPQLHVSVARKVQFDVAHYTTEGDVDDNAFSFAAFTRYIEELQSHTVAGDYIVEALLTVWLWRGHYAVKIRSTTIYLPLHSMTAFVWAILVTWNFNLLPAFFFFSVGWLMLACNEQMTRHPSRWKKCRAYWPMFSLLVANKSHTETIAPNESAEEIDIYESKIEDWMTSLAKSREEEREHEETLKVALGETVYASHEEEAVDITSSRTGAPSLRLLKPVLFPLQKKLRRLIRVVRVAKGIVLWEETYIAFWLTTVAFGLALASLIIPWGFLLRWALRLAVFVLLGPWMAVVDRCYFRTRGGSGSLRKRFIARYHQLLKASTGRSVAKERAIKLKAFKEFMFGRYLLRVPRWKESVFQSVPLASSSAEPYDSKNAKPINIVECRYGQVLCGDMIPMREIQMANMGGTHGQQQRRRRMFPFGSRNRENGQDSGERAPLVGRLKHWKPPSLGLRYHSTTQTS